MKISYDYKDIHGLVKNLVEDIRNEFKYDAIIGLSRGGLVPAALLGYELKIPVLSLCWSGADGNGDTQHNDWFQYPEITSPEDDTNINILVIDDICDSGHTLYTIMEKLRLRYEGTNVFFNNAVLVTKKEDNGNITPDFAGEYINKNVTWVDFPWESLE